jgi:hypothetical protein
MLFLNNNPERKKIINKLIKKLAITFKQIKLVKVKVKVDLKRMQVLLITKDNQEEYNNQN